MRNLVDEVPLIAENISINRHADAQSQNVIKFPEHVLDIALASLNSAGTLQSTHHTRVFSYCPNMPGCAHKIDLQTYIYIYIQTHHMHLHVHVHMYRTCVHVYLCVSMLVSVCVCVMYVCTYVLGYVSVYVNCVDVHICVRT